MAKISPTGRVSYPSVFKPNDYRGKKSYQLTLLFPKEGTDFDGMVAAAKEAARKKWGDKCGEMDIQWPIKDGDKDKRGDNPEYAGMMFVRFKTSAERTKPQVVDQAKRAITEESGKFYPGCKARVSFEAYAWDSDGDYGVSFALKNVQFMGDDEPFDGRTNAEDDFEAVASSSEGDEDLF